jgi:alanine racemase
VEISPCSRIGRADRLAVAFCGEAAPLRSPASGSRYSAVIDADPEEVFRYYIIPIVSDFRAAERLSKAAVARGIKLPVHVKIDTGMGRTAYIGNPAGSWRTSRL